MGPRAAGFVLALALAAATSVPASALKVVTYNLLNYPNISIAGRQEPFRVVMANLDPDVIIAQELNTAAGRDSFLTNVLNVVQPGEWNATAHINLGFGSGGAVFYKPAAVSISNFSSIFTGGPRNVMVCKVSPVGYGSTTSFRLYSVHFKAGQSSSDTTDRRVECTNLRNTLNTAPAGTHLLLGGDTNFYGSWEGGYIRLQEDQADNDGRLFDTVTLPGTWNQSGYSAFHSQSPCLTGCIGGGAGGGLDDRFDFWMGSAAMTDGENISIVPGSVNPYGNDGNHYNQNINAGTNTAVPAAVATALKNASDHIPVSVDIQLPAQISVAPTLDLDKAIINGPLGGPVSVSNVALVPADELDYTFSGTGDVNAPAGSHSVQPGFSKNSTVSLTSSTAGDKSGTLTIHSDDPDSPDTDVAISGRVLRRAEPSLDSLTALLSAPLDFGEHLLGEFSDVALKVFNVGYDEFQAGTFFYEGNIVGGDGRFSHVGGFTPGLMGADQTFDLRFDDTGATLDSTYTATLTLKSYDEPYPGALLLPDLVVSLSAKPVSSVTDVPRTLPTALSFAPPRPNPFNSGTRLAFDLPSSAGVSLEIYDASGRRVRTLTRGPLGAGHYEFSWRGHDDGGRRVAAGLYFVRFDTPGLRRVSRVVVLP